MEENYKVQIFMDNTYEVIKEVHTYGEVAFERVFQGSLADCESFIRLTNEGYL